MVVVPNNKSSNSSSTSSPQRQNNHSFPVPRSRTEGTTTTHLLPSTAPVSSLLPAIPTTASHHHAALVVTPATIQAQLAALMTQGAVTQQQQQQHASTATPSTSSLSFPHQPQTHLHHHTHSSPAQLLAAAAAHASAATAAVATNPLLTAAAVNMHHWSLEQLENHVKILHQLKQHVPPNVTMLLQEARKRAEKRHAKRVANRKSACTSRARKKALVQEMTALNARLRRQALILSLLPDLVIAIDIEGTITFCSAQVERVLQHSVDDLIGAKLTDIMVPGSQDKLQTLIQELLSPSSDQQDQGSTTHQQPQEQQAAQQEQGDVTSLQKSAKKAKLKKDNENDASARMAGDVSTNAVADTSFPLSVVQVDPAAGAPASLDENDNSDGSNNSKQPPSSLTNSSLGNSGSDDGTPKMDDRPIKKGVSNNSCSNNNKKLSKEDSQSSDSSNTSSTVSSDVKNLLSANANLERNVRWHNKNFMKDKRAGFKDDVLGAAVTANNASARLSSLQHRRSSDSSEEDSGYRESNDSREETSSSEGENSSESNGRRKPIAPTCNVCLIRDDLTTIWCEVTSSVRTKDTDDESGSSTDGKPVEKASRKRGSDEASMHGSDDAPEDKVDAYQFKEILLCLRPIRDGDEKTDEAHRFKPSKKTEKRVVSEDNRSDESNSSPTADGNSGETTSDPVLPRGKKRSRLSKRTPTKRHRSTEDDVDSAVVESLMSMSSQKMA